VGFKLWRGCLKITVGRRKKVGVDRYHVFVFVHARYYSYVRNYILLYTRNKINKLMRICLLPYPSLKAKMYGI